MKRRRIKLFLTGCCCSFFVAVLVTTYRCDGGGTGAVDFRALDDADADLPLSAKKRNKTILYWNTFFGERDYFGAGWQAFAHCEVNACHLTSDRRYLPIDEYDAIVFHAAEYAYAKHGAPARRHRRQRYVFYTWETSANRAIDAHTWHDFYNWTMTYWRKSDVYMPYGDVVREATNYTLPSTAFVRNKTRTVAWFVSNCRSKSKRQRYVDELRKHVDVDVYGKCGTMVCPRSTTRKCYEMLQEKYLFYLSFENTFCDDYVTEKLYLVLGYDVVPIVYGHANYAELAPPHSLVDTSRFASVALLARYLKRLKADPREYLRYFEWKREYAIYNRFAAEAVCTLCKKLHYDADDEAKSYGNVRDWWQGNCVDHGKIRIPT